MKTEAEPPFTERGRRRRRRRKRPDAALLLRVFGFFPDASGRERICRRGRFRHRRGRRRDDGGGQQQLETPRLRPGPLLGAARGLGLLGLPQAAAAASEAREASVAACLWRWRCCRFFLD